jgi:hypothetical protein
VTAPIWNPNTTVNAACAAARAETGFTKSGVLYHYTIVILTGLTLTVWAQGLRDVMQCREHAQRTKHCGSECGGEGLERVVWRHAASTSGRCAHGMSPDQIRGS